MATVDNFTLKVNVEGTAQIKQASTEITNLDKTAKTAGANLNQTANGIRNIGFQVQDFTVQVANGTSAVTALSQQLPQLLSNFGTIGVYLGIAAAAIPIVVAGFRLLGGDSRDLNDRIKDLTESTKNYIDAQKQNLPSLQGLGNEYGNLTGSAKDFLQVQQDLLKVKTEFDLTSSIRKLKAEFGLFSVDVKDLEKELGKVGAGYAVGGLDGIANAFKRMQLGLNAEQAKYVAEQLKNIDPQNTEATAETFNKLLNYLKESGAEGEKFTKFWNETVEPILNINKQVILLNQNIKNSAEQASAFNTELLKLQTSFILPVGDAKRNFDQVTALRLESAQKVAEFERQTAERTAKDQVDRSAEVAAFRAKTAAELANAEKDIAKQQYETFRGSYLTADAKSRQIELDGQIIDIQEKGRYNLQYETQLEIDRLRILKEYENTILSIGEQRRKNQITAEQGRALEREAQQAQDRANSNAEANRQRRIADARDAQIAAIFELRGREQGLENEREILKLRQDMRMGYPEDIDFAVKTAQLTQQQIEYERRINEEVRLGKITQQDAAERINQANANLAVAIGLERERNKEASRYRTGTELQGMEDTLLKIQRDIPTEYQKAGQKIQSVFDNIGSALDNFVRTGKLSFGDLARSIISDILRIELRTNYSRLFSGQGSFFAKLFGFGGGQTEAAGAAVLGLPGFARGGYLPSGQMGIVGENGPELITGPANITPFQQPQPMTINYNINAVDAASFRALVARDPQFIYAVTEQGRRSQPNRRLA